MIRESPQISRRQTTLSLIILSLLVFIGIGIVLTQSRFNRAILSSEALLSAASETAPTEPVTFLPAFKPLPPDIEPLTAAESFNPGTLSDKINGKAELYLSAGFSNLASQRFRAVADSDLWIEAFVYDMQNSQNAFAVYSVQRRENAESLGFAQYAYRSPNAVFFVHGRFYVELIASQASGPAIGSMEMLAATFVRNIKSESAAIAEQDLFPKEYLIENSISLITADAFGFEQLNQVHTAGYRINDSTLMAFLSRRKNSGEAENLALDYGRFLINFGGIQLDSRLPIKKYQYIEILDTFEIIFSHGAFVAGVREAATRDQAEKLAIQLFDQLSEVAGDP